MMAGKAAGEEKNTMKHKETADDRAVKDASAIKRAIGKEKFSETEDPEKYKKQKQLEKDLKKPQEKRTKEAREDREKTNIIKRILARWRNGRANG
jgi:plasmid replication initiation protein